MAEDNNYEEENDWELSSGGALDGKVATITRMAFNFDNTYGAGTTVATICFLPDDGEEREEKFSVGNAFVANRDGTRLEPKDVVRPGQKPPSISKMSNYGRLIGSVKAILGDDPKVLQGTIGGTKSTAGWIGTRWGIGTVEVKTNDPTKKDQAAEVKDKIIFTSYEGRSDDSGPAVSGKSDTTTKTTTSGKSSGNDDLLTFLTDKAKEMHAAGQDEDAFADWAADQDEVSKNPEVRRKVAKGEIWKAAVK